MGDDRDQPAALLTKAQRAYLRGEKDYRPSAARDVRQRIRDRFRAGVWDMSLLIKLLDLEDLKTLIGDDYYKWSSLVALVVIADELGKNYRSVESGSDLPQEPESTIDDGIRTGLHKLGHSWQSIEVAIERGDPLDDLAQQDPSELSQAELDQLLGVKKISREEYAREILRREDEEHREIMDETQEDFHEV